MMNSKPSISCKDFPRCPLQITVHPPLRPSPARSLRARFFKAEAEADKLDGWVGDLCAGDSADELFGAVE
jgi:hypothetical protein